MTGQSLKPQLDSPAAEGRPAFAYSKNNRTVRTATHRLILHKDGYAELYDHNSEAGETKNIADANPDKVEELTALIESRLAN